MMQNKWRGDVRNNSESSDLSSGSGDKSQLRDALMTDYPFFFTQKQGLFISQA